MINIKMLEAYYYVNGFAVPYELKKGSTINLYPILVKDYTLYEWSKQVLSLSKNETNDIRIIQMSYLDFLIEVAFIQNEEYCMQLRQLFNLCLHEPYIGFDKNKGRNCIIIGNEQGNVKQIISSKEFDDISKIILSQNDSKYDDRYVNPEVREMMEEYYKIKYKDITSPPFEKCKAFVSSKTGKSFAELNEIPYREFDLIYNACKDSEIYIGQKIIQGSYKYDVKEDVKHPLFEKPHDMYSDLFTDTSVLSSKGISGAEQLNAMNIANSIGK